MIPATVASAQNRTILHVDLDAFYASVEQRDEPALRGQPVIVGGGSRRGVVCAASYEARRYGVRSAMPMAQAMALCPHGIVRQPRMAHYADVSARFFAILCAHSPLVEGLSLDEAFVDVTAVKKLLGEGPQVAALIKSRVRKDLGLVASVGVAPNKFAAKIGSDLHKPDGLVVVEPDGLLAFLHPLPVGRLWGVGRVTEQALGAFGVRTIGDVASTPLDFLTARIGRNLAVHLHALANGVDERPVKPDREAVSMSHEHTFEQDEKDPQRLVPSILLQADQVAERLRRQGLRGRVVTLKIKYANHKLVTRRRTLSLATADGQTLGQTARTLLAEVPGIAQLGVRLTGIGVAGLEPLEANGVKRGDDSERDDPSTGTATRTRTQLAFTGLLSPRAPQLPEGGEARRTRARGERLGRALDDIRGRFGPGAIARAVCLNDGEPDESPE
ncbi:MAG: DNA polymerase IV [Myxococcales bacterium]|nr:DNA polymerase IV [Myxococcales bacterium]